MSSILRAAAILAVPLGVLTAQPKPKPPLAAVMEQIIQSTPATAGATLGMHVVEVATGRVVYTRNARRWFVPASNAKLFSTALALTRLGSNHRFHTRVVVPVPPDAQGRLAGNLRLVGGGDPTLSGRTYPYDLKAKWGDGGAALEALADAVVAKGVKAINGAVVGDDRRYVFQPYPAGWAADDALYEYGAPVSALILNDNSIRMNILPGARVGDPAVIEMNPPLEYFVVQNRVTTAPRRTPAKIEFERPAGTREIWMAGVVGLGKKAPEALFGVDDPALFAASALYDALLRRGVSIRSGYAAVHRYGAEENEPRNPPCDGCTVLAERLSPPLAQVVQVVNKESQNLHAEVLRREAGGDAALNALLAEAGIAATDIHLVDGSGLSRLTLLTPDAVTKLLVFMQASPEREAWMASLPVGAQDGTLERRFKGFPDAARVRAKTGGLSHVAALGGYLDHPTRGLLAFSVVVNNHNGKGSAVREVLDKLVMNLLEY